YEFDHVLVAEYEGPVKYDKEEVMDFCYKTMQEIRDSLQSSAQKYTAWFQLAFPKIETWWKERYKKSDGE
ncbi:MAG: isopentenyl-diphosphate Delta-isomerase, partial [Chitinophagaceae bacterium]